ncbi:MAG: ABC transporter permease [Pirellulaceae bacterium]
MYRWLLCWRYLRTRYIALASVVSVMLGVATLIVVNSVMDGFTTEMQDRMNGILSDVVVECHGANGLENPDVFERQIRSLVGDDLVGLTQVVHVPAMVSFNHRGEPINRQINLIGIDTESYASVSDFAEYLLHPENREQIDFQLKEGGYAPGRETFPESGWGHRRRAAQARKRISDMEAKLQLEKERNERLRLAMENATPNAATESLASTLELQAETGNAAGSKVTEQPSHGLSFPDPVHLSSSPGNGTAQSPATNTNGGPRFNAVASREEDVARVLDPEFEQNDGIVLGISIGTTRYRDAFGEVADYYYLRPGDDVRITLPSSGERAMVLHQSFTVVDLYESKMSEYDATFAFVPLKSLQKCRGMGNAVNSLQLKVREGADLNAVRDAVQSLFPLEMGVQVSTWRDLQGALLAAVQMETTILNILLFLIIAVAGFGILATFFMIVVEKTKDIGILKSLGAGGTGVASIFLGYGVLLGAFGAGVGAIAGLVFVANINLVADLLERVTGQEVFDPTVYYFETIPTIVHPAMVVWVIIGAIAIAVMASVLPSIRAARMHPVEALRYE